MFGFIFNIRAITILIESTDSMISILCDATVIIINFNFREQYDREQALDDFKTGLLTL